MKTLRVVLLAALLVVGVVASARMGASVSASAESATKTRTRQNNVMRAPFGRAYYNTRREKTAKGA